MSAFPWHHGSEIYFYCHVIHSMVRVAQEGDLKYSHHVHKKGNWEVMDVLTNFMVAIILLQSRAGGGSR